MADEKRGMVAKKAGSKPASEAPARRDTGKELRGSGGRGARTGPDRRLQLVPSLLLTALILGIIWMVTYFTSILIPVGVPGVIPGQVVGPDGAPVEGALVTLEPASLNISAVTDANGNFTLTGMQTGRTAIVISKENYTTTTYQVYALPAPANSSFEFIRTTFPLARGSGTASYDAASARDQLATVCLIVFLIGNIMTASAFMAVLTKRRYSMALMGSLLGTIALGFWMGAVLNVVACFMIRSARDQFADQSGIVAPGGVPSLTGEDDADEGEDEGAPEKGGGEGEAEDGDGEEPRR